MEKRITEYILIFKEGTDSNKQYNGEFISEDKDQTDRREFYVYNNYVM